MKTLRQHIFPEYRTKDKTKKKNIVFLLILGIMIVLILASIYFLNGKFGKLSLTGFAIANITDNKNIPQENNSINLTENNNPTPKLNNNTKNITNLFIYFSF